MEWMSSGKHVREIVMESNGMSMSNVSGEEGTPVHSPRRAAKRRWEFIAGITLRRQFSVVGLVSELSWQKEGWQHVDSGTNRGEGRQPSGAPENPMMKAGRESRNKEPSFAPRVREHRLLETVFPVTCGDKSFYMIMFFFMLDVN